MTEKPVYCSRCGRPLTSKRSIRQGIGIRCKWARDGLTRKRTTTQGQGMPIDDIPFDLSGNNSYQRKIYEYWD